MAWSARRVLPIISLVFLYIIKVSSSNSLHEPGHVHNKDHLMEDLREMMPDQEFNFDNDESFEFHYFKLHDYDNNNRLDGLELGAAMTHFHESGDTGKKQRQIDIGDAELADLIKQMLKTDDLNDDGYVDYYEFIKSQRKSEQPK